MRNVVVFNNVTLDGVMQAPGRPDEDTRGGFEHGGWAIPGNDEVMERKMGEGVAGGGGAAARPPYLRGLLRVLAQPVRQPVHRSPQQHSEVRGLAHAQGA